MESFHVSSDIAFPYSSLGLSLHVFFEYMGARGKEFGHPSAVKQYD